MKTKYDLMDKLYTSEAIMREVNWKKKGTYRRSAIPRTRVSQNNTANKQKTPRGRRSKEQDGCRALVSITHHWRSHRL
jgi:hypothetical protein